MQVRQMCCSLLAIAMVSFLCENPAAGQPPRLRIQNNRTYDVTIVSHFGRPVRVGIFGYSQEATFRVTFDGGLTGPDVFEQELIGGDRVVIVWDTTGRRLLVADLTVDSDGVLPLQPMAAQARAAAEPQAAGAVGGNPIPQLRISPQN